MKIFGICAESKQTFVVLPRYSLYVTQRWTLKSQHPVDIGYKLTH